MARICGRTLGGLFLATASVVHGAETIEIPFQEALLRKELLNINVELGGYDVTPFADVTGDGVRITLETELSAGEFEVSVIAFYQDGEIQTLAEQLIEIAAEPSTQWQYNSTLKTAYRVEEEQTADFQGVEEYTAGGGVDAGFSHSAGSFTVTGNLQSVYDANTAYSETGNEWEVATYQVGVSHSGDYGGVGLYAGNNQVSQESLLFAGYQRRGFQLQAHNAGQTLQGALFSVISDNTTSYDNDLLVPENSSQSTLGGTLSFNPFAFHPDRLLIGVGFVDGEGTTAGSGFTVVDPDTVYGGSSWNTSVDSLWLNRSLWFHLEYAESDFDSDGIGVGEDEINDAAFKFLINLNSNGDLPSLGLDFWDLTVQQQEIGNFFYSIANLGIAGDLDARRLTLNGNKGGFGFRLELLRQENNVDNDPARATLSVDYSGLDLNYTPMVDSSSGIWSVIGAPSLYGYVHLTESVQEEDKAQLTGFDVDNENSEYAVGINFSAMQWSWGVSHTYTEVDDRTSPIVQNQVVVYQPPPDNETRLTSLQLSWYPSTRLVLSPSLQWTTYQEAVTANEYKTLNAGIDSQVQIIPERLLFAVNYFFTGNDNSFGDPEFLDSEMDNYTGTFQLTWKARQPKTNWPGLDVFVNGSYGRQHDKVFNNNLETWQVNIGFDLYWAGNKE